MKLDRSKRTTIGGARVFKTDLRLYWPFVSAMSTRPGLRKSLFAILIHNQPEQEQQLLSLSWILLCPIWTDRPDKKCTPVDVNCSLIGWDCQTKSFPWQHLVLWIMPTFSLQGIRQEAAKDAGIRACKHSRTQPCDELSFYVFGLLFDYRLNIKISLTATFSLNQAKENSSLGKQATGGNHPTHE